MKWSFTDKAQFDLSVQWTLSEMFSCPTFSATFVLLRTRKYTIVARWIIHVFMMVRFTINRVWYTWLWRYSMLRNKSCMVHVSMTVYFVLNREWYTWTWRYASYWMSDSWTVEIASTAPIGPITVRSLQWHFEGLVTVPGMIYCSYWQTTEDSREMALFRWPWDGYEIILMRSN